MTPLLVSLIAIVFSCLLGLFGYLLKRSIFGENDLMRKEIESLRKELREMDAVKSNVDLCIRTHQAISENLSEIRKGLTENSKTLQQVQIDLAVVKTKIEERG